MIPNKALVVSPISQKKLTVGEIILFQGKDFNALTFRNFLVKYTNWTSEEIDEVTVEELEEVFTELGKKLEEQAIPK
jgi:hypothetical protein